MYRRRYTTRLHQKNEEARRAREQEYWPRVWESDGFDIDHLKRPYLTGGMLVFKREPDDYPVLLHLYAKMGLHKYNMFQGTNLELHHIEKYNRDFKAMPSAYYITLVAVDPSTGSPVTFQTSIHESSCNVFDVKCFVARPKTEETKCSGLWDDKTAPEFSCISVPKWPSADALANNIQFYVVPESEWKETEWIRLYMELAFITTHRVIPIAELPKLSDMKIEDVVVQTRKIVNPPKEKLNGARNATIYIAYKQELGEGRFLKHKAIIRRSVCLRTKRLSLVGVSQELGLDVNNQELGLVGYNQQTHE